MKKKRIIVIQVKRSLMNLERLKKPEKSVQDTMADIGIFKVLLQAGLNLLYALRLHLAVKFLSMMALRVKSNLKSRIFWMILSLQEAMEHLLIILRWSLMML